MISGRTCLLRNCNVNSKAGLNPAKVTLKIVPCKIELPFTVKSNLCSEMAPRSFQHGDQASSDYGKAGHWSPGLLRPRRSNPGESNPANSKEGASITLDAFKSVHPCEERRKHWVGCELSRLQESGLGRGGGRRRGGRGPWLFGRGRAELAPGGIAPW